jgi:long-chain acyl-CoA synthetase
VTMLSLASVLAEAARRHPDKVAVVDGPLRTTYVELWRQARSYAAGLKELGIRPGDTVAVLIPNVTDFPRVYYGALAAGARIVPVHLLLTAEEMAYVLRDSGADLLVAHTSQLQTAATAAHKADLKIATVGPVPEGVPAPPPRLEEAAAAVEPLPTFERREAEDVAVIFYTSGTTGKPKGALLTHLNLVMNATVNVFDVNDVQEQDVLMGCLPLFHTFGQSLCLNGGFRVGATVVLMARFTGQAALELMVREKVTVFHGVPTMFMALLDAASKADHLPALRICGSGGAPLPVAVLERFTETFGTTIFEGYGLSETSPTATSNQPQWGVRPGTIGHPIWGVEVEIARAEIEERIELLPTGEVGEIVIRGHNVFAGYHNKPEETARAVVDGWFRSGDLGIKDDKGYVTIVDRKKDLILRGGFNVYPREIEEVLARHPAVVQVAVIGVPDERLGEEICAVVVTDREGLTAEELVAWAQERLGRHKYPRQVRFMDELPMGPSFKVLKRELRRVIGGE